MTQVNQDLLLKYLCMALPYGVKIKYVNTFCKIKQVVFEEHSTSYSFGDDNFSLSVNDIQTWKPYLRPMSSMTEEEINEFILISDTVLWLGEKRSTCILSLEQIYWLLKNHFDFMGLIPKGLAIEVTKDNNPYESNM